MSAQQQPLTKLLAGVGSSDIAAQLNAAHDLQARGLMLQPQAKEAVLAAVMRDIRVRFTPAGWNDPYMDQLGQLISIAENAYGVQDPGVADALLHSAEYVPRSDLAYQLADQGSHIYPAVMDMLHDPMPDNRSNAVGVLGDMLTEQRHGRVKDPISSAQIERAKQAILASLDSTDIGVISSGVWVLSQIRDPSAIPSLESVIRRYPDPHPGGTRARAYRSITIIRFCCADTPMTSAELLAFLPRFDSTEWEARARAFYSLIAGNTDPFYGPRVKGILEHFPGQTAEITQAFISLLTVENKAVASSTELQQDPVYKAYYADVDAAAAQLKDPAADAALVGALGYNRVAFMYVAQNGAGTLPALLEMFHSQKPKQRAEALAALAAMASYLQLQGVHDPTAFDRLAGVVADALRDPVAANREQALGGADVLKDYAQMAKIKEIADNDPDAAVRKKAGEIWADLDRMQGLHLSGPCSICGAH